VLLLTPAGSQAGGSQDLARFFKRLASAKPHELPAECGRVRLFIEDSAGWRQEESWMVCNMLGAGEPTDCSPPSVPDLEYRLPAVIVLICPVHLASSLFSAGCS
jgi:hypothetical protein